MAFNEKQAQNEINTLKVRAFDTEEQLRQTNNTLQQFSSALAQVLELEGEQAQNPQSYIDAILALKQSKEDQGEIGAELEELDTLD